MLNSLDYYDKIKKIVANGFNKLSIILAKQATDYHNKLLGG
jgi:hypothetical protein